MKEKTKADRRRLVREFVEYLELVDGEVHGAKPAVRLGTDELCGFIQRATADCGTPFDAPEIDEDAPLELDDELIDQATEEYEKYLEEIEKELAVAPGVLDIVVYEGQSKRGMEHNAIVAEIYPDKDYIEKNNITDIQAHLQKYIDDYNRGVVPYKKIGVLKVREDEFPKNTLRKIMRFKLDMSID